MKITFLRNFPWKTFSQNFQKSLKISQFKKIHVFLFSKQKYFNFFLLFFFLLSLRDFSWFSGFRLFSRTVKSKLKKKNENVKENRRMLSVFKGLWILVIYSILYLNFFINFIKNFKFCKIFIKILKF